VFVLDQCLSVRALQEMLANHEDQCAGVGTVMKSTSDNSEFSEQLSIQLVDEYSVKNVTHTIF